MLLMLIVHAFLTCRYLLVEYQYLLKINKMSLHRFFLKYQIDTTHILSLISQAFLIQIDPTWIGQDTP